MEAMLQRRIQRYGWDRAAPAYEPGWQVQLEPAHSMMLGMADPRAGDHVLDVACGTGIVSFRLATTVGIQGSVLGTDISERMIEAATFKAGARSAHNIRFIRCDAEQLELPDRQFDVAVCGLGLMYFPEPVRALREMHRVLRPAGKAAAAVWGARRNCSWAEIFPITDARVASDVCPMFFHLGTNDTLAEAFARAGFVDVQSRRISTVLRYPTAQSALSAAFLGGPVALAYSRFDEATRAAVHAEYLNSIAAYRVGDGYRIPGEFVVAAGRVAPSRA